VFDLELASYKCVRTLAKSASCDACVGVCPTSAITIESITNLPAVLPSACVGCGACMGSCPTQAWSMSAFNATDFFFEIVQAEQPLLSCRKNIPCLAALNEEHLLGLALLRSDVVLDTAGCSSCEWALKAHIDTTIESVEYLLDAMQSPHRLHFTQAPYMPEGSASSNRREFLEKITLKNIVHAKANFDKAVDIDPDTLKAFALDTIDVAQIRNKQFPDKRKILLTALKRTPTPEVLHVVDGGEVHFISDKRIDASLCTACQMCYRVCPTQALKSDYKASKITFDASLCLKCHLCHDVCEPKAITLKEGFDIGHFFAPATQNLVAFTVRLCNECGTYFHYKGGEVTCARCQIEEDEAKELWGLHGK